MGCDLGALESKRERLRAELASVERSLEESERARHKYDELQKSAASVSGKIIAALGELGFSSPTEQREYGLLRVGFDGHKASGVFESIPVRFGVTLDIAFAEEDEGAPFDELCVGAEVYWGDSSGVLGGELIGYLLEESQRAVFDGILRKRALICNVLKELHPGIHLDTERFSV